MKRNIATAAIIAVVGIGAGAITYAASGRTSAAPPEPHAVATQVQAANPVEILRQMHVPIPAGVSVGQVDIYGDRYATAQFADLEQVTVYTYASQLAETAGIGRFGPSSDADKLLIGNLFTVTVTGVDEGGGGISFPDAPITLARETGSTIK